MSDSSISPTLSPTRLTATMFNVSTKTVERWRKDPKMLALGFPSPPIEINGRFYDDLQRLEQFRDNLLKRALSSA